MDGLEAAWAAAEAALPEGWVIWDVRRHERRGRPDEWEVYASPRMGGRPGAHGAGLDPAAALRALAERLRDDAAPTCSGCGHEAAIHYRPERGDTVPECAGTGPDGLGCRCVLTPDQVRAEHTSPDRRA